MPRPHVIRTENCVEFEHAVFEILERTDKYTHIYRHSHDRSTSRPFPLSYNDEIYLFRTNGQD